MSRYRATVYGDPKGDHRWLAQRDFDHRPGKDEVTAAFPVLSTPGRYEIRLGLLSGEDEIHAGGWLQGEPATCPECSCTVPPTTDDNAMIMDRNCGVHGTQVQVRRDGEVVATVANSNAAFKWLLDHTPMSVDWAIRYEGYTVTDFTGTELPEYRKENLR